MNVNFCKNFVALRKMNGFTQESIAEKCGVSRQAITKWESGSSLPDMYKLVDISTLFDVSIDELICGDIKYESPEVKIDDKHYESIMAELEEIKSSIRKNNDFDDENDSLYEEYLCLVEYPDESDIIAYRDYLATSIDIIPEYLGSGRDKVWKVIKELILIERGSFPEILSYLYDLSSILYEMEYDETCPNNKYIDFVEMVADIMPSWSKMLKNEIEIERAKPGRFM